MRNAVRRSFLYRLSLCGDFPYLNDRLIVYETQVAAAEHGVRARGRIVANAALGRVQLVVDDRHFQKGRITSNGQAEKNGLCGRQKENKQKHTAVIIKEKVSCWVNYLNRKLLPLLFLVLPNISESLHKIFSNKSHCAVRRWRGQVESPATAFGRHARTGGRTTATATRVTCAAATGTRTTTIGTATAMFQVEESILGLNGWSVISAVELVHLVQLLVAASAHLLFVTAIVRVEQTVISSSWTERQSDNAVLLGHGKDRFATLPILSTQWNLHEKKNKRIRTEFYNWWNFALRKWGERKTSKCSPTFPFLGCRLLLYHLPKSRHCWAQTTVVKCIRRARFTQHVTKEEKRKRWKGFFFFPFGIH